MSNPPVIEENVLPTTPVQEWANTTTSSLRDHSGGNINTGTDSETSTPGLDFPGAFPCASATESMAGNVNVFDTAKGYIPSQRAVKDAVINAGGTAKQYLPAALTSYFPPSTPDSCEGGSDPSRQVSETSLSQGNGQARQSDDDSSKDDTTEAEEEREVEPKHNGIECAPKPMGIDTSFLTADDKSNTHTESVPSSKLSTQTQHGSETSMTFESDTPAREDASPPFVAPPTPGEASGQKEEISSSVETLSEDRRHTSSTEFEGELKEQQDDTRSGEEFQGVQAPVLNTKARTHPLAGAGATWNSVPLEEPYQRALDAHSDRQLNLGAGKGKTSATKAENRESTTEEVKDEAVAVKDSIVGPSTDEAPERPAQPNIKKDSTSADAGHSPVVAHKREKSAASNVSPLAGSAPQASKVKSTTSGTSGPSKGSSPHKGTFMNKIKGEVKVISGRLAHNEVKIEEGKRLLGKGA
ncbi:hypothetical protein D9615_007081 [Tricholomella constricta]|uniref:Uncharacterized protein n=1 Tax=Tricholomella constricta TaxID=117010 RepID=A0A8H5H8B5_9AGAR|nr:hypothetical protein D9615_007081 [Tricholomella constricta]